MIKTNDKIHDFSNKKKKKMPEVYKCYGDDKPSVMTDVETASEFLTLNNSQPSIEFTMEL